MSNKILGTILALAASGLSVSASAMTEQERPCTIVGAEKLPPDTGGASAICAVIEKAIAEQAPTVTYTARVEVLSKSALKATVVSNGRTLAQQELSVMDRNLNAGSIERFATAIAAQVAKAAKA